MSASGHLVRNRSVSSSSKSLGRANNMPDHTMAQPLLPRFFDPCAATAGMFLYAQGNSVVCCHHDTLTIERRFSRHQDEIQLLAVDTQSDRGAGRLVVSYDAGQTAIVWDIMTGDEVARFASYEHLTTAAWMRNGNVAFGNTQGNIILFEPETSEHISSRTIDQIAVTALAPAADCRTFAIGYQNGSLLICNLQPRFTILHNLTTNRAPSPVVNLAWHASSSRQKSDMLAVQTLDGDLRVWSVSKAYNSADPAKVVRILKRKEVTAPLEAGPNWMGWSKNGRIIQMTETDTLSWDVRTKHVTFDVIPTLEHIRGLAVYGPAATLFTLGANNTVQQFDLNAPAVMVQNCQHPANLLPPSPPVSIEEQEKGVVANNPTEIAIHIEGGVSESDDDRMSPLARMIQHREPDSEEERYRSSSPISSRHGSSVSSASSRTPGQYQSSVLSRGLTENTYISAGSSIGSSAAPGAGGGYGGYGAGGSRRERDSYSTASLSSVSMTSSTSRSRHRPSRLRNEVVSSPQDNKVQDLFKFTKSRLSDVPYKPLPLGISSRRTNDDLRRQMLSIIFGWNKEMEDLVRDEMSRHPMGSTNRILLAKWLGEVDVDIMGTSSEHMTSSDWMMLALSGIGSQASQYKLGRAYTQRLLESGDVHAAATILVGMGDQNDAIEVYVSHKKYMEALILTCIFFPAVWERQSQIVKKWGEWAVQHGQQQLAIRCFACIGTESSEVWASPSAAQLTFQPLVATSPDALSPPLSPPGFQRGPQRSIAKTSALKLITSFGDQSAKAKFFSGQDDGQTPIAAGVTPIAESAISPGGNGDLTAFIRPSNRSQFNTPSSARPSVQSGAGPFARQPLPSIGEITNDGTPRSAKKATNLPTPPVDRVDRLEIRGHQSKGSYDDNMSSAMSIGRAATASPMMMRDRQRKRDPPPPSPSPASMAVLMEGRASRNGPRNRIPEGVDLHLHSVEPEATAELTSPEPSVASSTRFHWPSRRRGPGSVASSVTSASAASNVSRSHRHRGQDTAGKSLDDYIHSLDVAKGRRRASSRDGHTKPRDHSRSRTTRSRERSADRGRNSSRGYTPKAGKRSPRSPVPMSPEDLINLTTPQATDKFAEQSTPLIDIASEEPSTVRKAVSQIRHSSKTRAASRDRRPPAIEIPRGRSSKKDDGSLTRSPSSPQPMSAHPDHFYGSDDDEDYRRAMEAKEKFRNRNNRSTSRGFREPSPGSLHGGRDRSRSRRALKGESPENRIRTPGLSQLAAGGSHTPLVHKDLRALKKEAAARELEERRKSLARRPAAPSIPHPDELSPMVTRAPDLFAMLPSTTFALPSTTFVPPKDLPTRSATVEPGATRGRYNSHRSPPIGLPATPKAMRLIMDPSGAPGVPAIPATFAQRHSPTGSSPGQTSPKSGSPRKQQQQQQQQQQQEPAAGESLLTLLPSTVYSPPMRPPISRCMSAPPEEPIAPKRLQGGIQGGSSASGIPSFQSRGVSRGQSVRKLSTPDVHPSANMRTIDSLLDNEQFQRRPSLPDNYNNMVPPPPPPAPVVLKELAHLALPPPPPPAPLPIAGQSKPFVYGGQPAGTIEIIMDDGQTQLVPPPPPPPPTIPVAIPVSEATVPILAAPAPPSSRNAHHSQMQSSQSQVHQHQRGRSSVDNSIGGRFARATERMRSASRSRQSSSVVNRTKSPEMVAPYESIPPPPPPPMPMPTSVAGMSYQARLQQQQQQQAQQAQPLMPEYRTGLHESEMI